MMDGNKLNELRELVEFLKANEIAEFDMEQDDLKVRIKFAGEPAVAAPAGGFDMAHLSRLMASAPAASPVTAPAAVSPAAPAAEAEEKLHEVKSPIVGRLLCASSARARRWAFARLLCIARRIGTRCMCGLPMRRSVLGHRVRARAI